MKLLNLVALRLYKEAIIDLCNKYHASEQILKEAIKL